MSLACGLVANAVLTDAFWLLPATAIMETAAPAVLVRLKLAVPDKSGTDALTEYHPAVVLAVKIGAMATPELLVTAVATLLSVDEKVPLLPPNGAVNVTVTPLTGVALMSVTDTCNRVG